MIGHTYHKRYVTRTVVEIRGGLVWCRDTWLDGTTRVVACQPWQLERWLNGAVESKGALA